ncbi:MAG TPA: mechanosensitive ion channel domain-containing protein [Candidatus Polarisedimenticolia bacterium]|nr:mechanosensitive ion channel domain-containing protein [Candidatus Polarisedimenticolia bacterium]
MRNTPLRPENRPATPPLRRGRPALLLATCFLAFAGIPSVAADSPTASPGSAPGGAAYEAQTAKDPAVPLDQLSLMVKPLTRDELVAESDGWLALVKAKVKSISDLEISVKRKNEQIASAERLSKAAEEASRALKDAEAKAGSGEADQEELRKLRERAEQAALEVKQAADEAKAAERKAAGDESVEDATQAALRRAEAEGQGATAPTVATPTLRNGATGATALESAARKAEQAAEAKAEVKSVLLEDLTSLREERTALIDRANVVLEELAAKGGEVDLQKKYLKAVSGIQVEVSDTAAAWATVTGWLASPEGGLRYAKNLAICIATVLGAWLLSRLAGRLVRRSVAASGMTDLMQEFIAKAVRFLILAIGVMIGISALEINVSPLLAAIGGLALVVAFALQGALSNFASGILILAYHPFDVGDDVTAGGVSGKVQSMNMLSTQILTADNRLMTVPNNQIWGSVITNAASAETRRVDLSIDILPGIDALEVQARVEEFVRRHPLVLADPEPVVRLNEIGHLATKLVCRPWTKSGDYQQVYWDVTQAASGVLSRGTGRPAAAAPERETALPHLPPGDAARQEQPTRP